MCCRVPTDRACWQLSSISLECTQTRLLSQRSSFCEWTATANSGMVFPVTFARRLDSRPAGRQGLRKRLVHWLPQPAGLRSGEERAQKTLPFFRESPQRSHPSHLRSFLSSLCGQIGFCSAGKFYCSCCSCFCFFFFFLELWIIIVLVFLAISQQQFWGPHELPPLPAPPPISSSSSSPWLFQFDVFRYQRKVSRNPATKAFNEDHAQEILAARDMMMIYAAHSLPNSKRTICKNKKAAHMELNKSIAASFQTPGA